MSFKIRNIKGATSESINLAIVCILDESRFNCNISNDAKSVTLSKIRLRQSKDYCGNHPLPCPVRPGPHKPHIHSTCLEGADWVAFNDMLNDILDMMKVSADVASSLVIIRKGEKRCVEYKAQPLGNGIDNEWVKDSGRFESRLGVKSLRSEYPRGTPGIAEYLTT